MSYSIAHIALPVPLDRSFDYLIKPGQAPVIGGRVKVPFGRQRLIGVVVKLSNESEFSREKLKGIDAVLDNASLWPPHLYKLLNWGSTYYQYPLGETLANAMPAWLRKGREASFAALKAWQITELGKNQDLNKLTRAPKQAKALNLVRHQSCSHEQMLEEEITAATLKNVNYIERPANAKAQTSVALYKLNEDETLATNTLVKFGEKTGRFIEIREGAQVNSRFIISDLSNYASQQITID